MANKTKAGDSIFGKMGELFSSKEDESTETVNAKVVEGGFITGLKNRLFGEKVEDVIDIEAFELVTADMELVVREQELNPSGELVITTEIVAMEQLEHRQGLFSSIATTASVAVGTIKSTAVDSWDFTTNKWGTAKNATVEFSGSTANSLVHLGKGIGKKYDEISFTPKFYSFVKTIDLVVVVSALQLYNKKQKQGSKEFIAISTVIAILVLLERSKSESKEDLIIEGVDEKLLSQDLPTLLKSVKMKDLVETAEPILLFVPNGNYILLILRLFV